MSAFYMFSRTAWCSVDKSIKSLSHYSSLYKHSLGQLHCIAIHPYMITQHFSSLLLHSISSSASGLIWSVVLREMCGRGHCDMLGNAYVCKCLFMMLQGSLLKCYLCIFVFSPTDAAAEGDIRCVNQHTCHMRHD